MKTKILLLFMVTLYCCTQLSAQTLDRSYSTTDGVVKTTLQNGNTLYLGGSFSNVGLGFKRLASYKPGSIKPEASFPQITGTIYAMEPDGNGGFYIGGYNITYFDTVVVNNNVNKDVILIHVNADRSLDTAFASIQDNYGFGSVTSIKKQGNRLYIGGSFIRINSSVRDFLAALDPATGALLSWTAATDENTDQVYTIEATESLVFATGYFNNYGILNNSTNGLATFSASTGARVKNFPTIQNNGDTSALKIKNNKLYVGTLATNTGLGAFGVAKVENTAGLQDVNFPQTDGNVDIALPDGSGGYYIGGYFSHVGSVAKTSIAHILPDGTVDPAFTASADYGSPGSQGEVYSLASDGTNLYIGGVFLRVDATFRNNLAAVSLTTGALAAWNPNANNSVYTMVYSGGNIYIGGDFTTVKATTRNYAAAVSTANTLTPWNPNCDATVYQVLPNQTGTSFFLAGNFYTVKGTARNYLAKVDNATGALSSWNPNPDNYVQSIALKGNILYAGGGFTAINGISKHFVAAIDTASNSPTSFSADANNYVNTLSLSNNKLYVGGYFKQIQSIARNYAARIDLTTNTIDNWNPSADQGVYFITATANSTVLGGYFYLCNAYPTNHIFNIDVNTYQPGSFAPSGFTWRAFGSINSLYFSGNELFAGGNFSYNNGGSYNKSDIICLDTATGGITRIFDKFTNGTINAVSISNNKLLVGGSFSAFSNTNGTGSVTRTNLASYDLATNTLSSDIYDPNSAVRVLQPGNDGGIIAAGDFTLTNAVSRTNLAAIDLTTGLATPFNATTNSQVLALAIKDSVLFVGGSFSNLNSYTRNFIGAANINTGATTSWLANANGAVNTLALVGSTLYVGGVFTTLKSTARKYAAAVTTGGATVLAWNPNLNSTVTTLLVNGSNVYLGGSFTTVGGTARNYLAKVDAINGTLAGWNPAPNSTIYTLAKDTAALYVGGTFSSISSKAIFSVAKFSLATDTLFSAFDAKLRNSGSAPLINSLSKWGNTLFAGSSGITKVNNMTRGNLFGINTITDSATDFNPQPDNTVYSVNVGTNKLYTGGGWLNIQNKLSPSYFAVFTLEPLTQASGLNFTNIQPTSVTGNFTAGSGESRLVVIKQGATPGSPKDSKGYTANAAFKQGDTTTTGSFVVYGGSGAGVNITNLRPNHSYTGALFEYNGSGSGSDYLTSPLVTGNFSTPCPKYNLHIGSSGPLSICGADSVILSAPTGFASYAWSNGKTTRQIAAKTSGSYTVTATDSNGCSGTTPPVTVTAKPLAAKPGVITGINNSLCGQSGVHYSIDSAANATSYAWTVPKNTVINSGQGTTVITVTFPANLGTGYVIVKGVNSCGSSVGDSLKVIGNPSTPTIKGPTTVSAHQTGRIYSVVNYAGVTYTWSVPSDAIIVSGQGTNSINVTWGTATGAVTVYATNSCGSSAIKSLTVTVSTLFASTDADNPDDAATLKTLAEGATVYPNPANSNCTVVFNAANNSKYSIIVADIAGKQLLKKDWIAAAGENKVSLDINKFAPGMYLIIIINDRNEKIMLKLNKE